MQICYNLLGNILQFEVIKSDIVSKNLSLKILTKAFEYFIMKV